MNPKLFLCLALAGVLCCCSKTQDASSPSTNNPVVTNASATPTAGEKASLDALTTVQPVTSGVTNSVASNAAVAANAVIAGTTNTAQISSASVNAAGKSVLDQLAGTVASPSPSASSTVAPSDAPHPAVGANLASLASLSTDQVTQGLKEALGKGLSHAVATLGQPGGFLTNMNVKIPLPDKLQTAEKVLRAAGEGQLADQCIATMNQAAEQAVPAAADVFANSLKNMSIDDAKAILNGSPDAATQFFRRTTQAELTQKFSPIVQQAMTKCGTTAAYQQVVDKAKGVSPLFSAPSLDLNAYVTSKAMDGLFKMVAEEEKSIRENPVARSTDLLKTVFGSLQK